MPSKERFSEFDLTKNATRYFTLSRQFWRFCRTKSGRQTVADRFSKDDQADLLLAF